jgi:carboxymethylenebutenolidase
MKLRSEWLEFSVGDSKVQGFFSCPAVAQGPLPGVLVIQEVWGVDSHIQDVSERFASAGYAVLAPDLFSYGGKPAPLAPERIEDAKLFLDTLPPPAWFDPAQRTSALAALPEARRAPLEETLGLLLNRNRPWDQYVATLRAARAWLAGGPSKGRKIGAVGFCMGGALSLRLACADPELAASVIFYGMAPPAETLGGLRCPVLGLYAENDPNITGSVPALVDAMKQQGKRFEHHIYPGVPHAFFNDSRGAYRPDTARDAWARTLSFFATHLA